MEEVKSLWEEKKIIPYEFKNNKKQFFKLLSNKSLFNSKSVLEFQTMKTEISKMEGSYLE